MPLVHTRDNIFITVSEKDNLLESLEKAGVQIDYQCRNGYCGACRTVVRNGEVAYQKQPLAYISPTEILPCCCSVKSENLELEIYKNPPHNHLKQQHDDDDLLLF